MTNEQNKEEHIQRALEAGLDTLFRDSVQGIQMPNIAEKIGVSSRSMTRYFGTKENYICAILEKMCQDDLKLARAYAKESHVEELSGIEQIRTFFNAIPKFYLSQGKKSIAIMDATNYLCNSNYQERVTEVYKNVYGAYTQRIKRFLNVGIEDGTVCLGEMSTEFYADSIMNTFWGILQQLTFANNLGLYTTDYCNIMLQNYIEHILKSIEVK